MANLLVIDDIADNLNMGQIHILKNELEKLTKDKKIQIVILTSDICFAQNMSYKASFFQLKKHKDGFSYINKLSYSELTK